MRLFGCSAPAVAWSVEPIQAVPEYRYLLAALLFIYLARHAHATARPPRQIRIERKAFLPATENLKSKSAAIYRQRSIRPCLQCQSHIMPD